MDWCKKTIVENVDEKTKKGQRIKKKTKQKVRLYNKINEIQNGGRAMGNLNFLFVQSRKFILLFHFFTYSSFPHVYANGGYLGKSKL